VIWTDIPQKNVISTLKTKKIILKFSIIIIKGSKPTTREEIIKLLGKLETIIRNNNTPKYTKNEDYSDNVSNYDENFDFEDTRALRYQRKQNNKYIIKNINLLEVIPNNNKHTHDFDYIYNKSIDFINHSNNNRWCYIVLRYSCLQTCNKW